MANSIPLDQLWWQTVQCGEDQFLTNPIRQSDIEEAVEHNLSRTDGTWKVVIRTDTLIVVKDVTRRVHEVSYWKDNGR